MVYHIVIGNTSTFFLPGYMGWGGAPAAQMLAIGILYAAAFAYEAG